MSLLEQFDYDIEKIVYVDKIMEKTNAAELFSILSVIIEMELSEISMAYDLVIAIHNVKNINNYNYSEAYILLEENENNSVYKYSVRHLAITLNNKGDTAINIISDAEDITRSEIAEFLDCLDKCFQNHSIVRYIVYGDLTGFASSL